MPLRCTIYFALSAFCAAAQLTPEQRAQNVASFETVWSTVRDRHPDPKLNGLDWQKIHDSTLIKIEKARSLDEARDILRNMLSQLKSSHYAVIPSGRYQESAPASDSPGKLVSFGNLPESRLIFESRRLAGGAGYVHFNEFMDPVSLMPQFESALQGFTSAPGIVLDLRGNPGGIGVMAMGIAGFFIDKTGLQLGEMRMKETTVKFAVFPRVQTYHGKLAILLDGGSASTTEILAQGLQDLKRARIFGSRSQGAALPSDIVRLPNGDGFQFAQASYTSVGGSVIEGKGVTPDVATDQPLEAAEAWIAQN